jgi:hypothetical protein
MSEKRMREKRTQESGWLALRARAHTLTSNTGRQRGRRCWWFLGMRKRAIVDCLRVHRQDRERGEREREREERARRSVAGWSGAGCRRRRSECELGMWPLMRRTGGRRRGARRRGRRVRGQGGAGRRVRVES